MKKRIRRKQQRRCKEKQAFKEYWQAKKFLKKLPLADVYLKVYKCPVCKKYHVACKNKEIKILYLLRQLEKSVNYNEYDNIVKRTRYENT